MTEQQYGQFLAQLTETFPGIANYITLGGGDPAATYRRWYPVVEPFHYSDALDVLKELTIRGMDAADIKLPMHTVRSMLAQKAAQRRKADRARNQAMQSADRQAALEAHRKSNLQECFLELRPIHQRFLDGELTRLEYQSEKNYVLDKVL